MASRSFKPASYLASTTNRSPRPSFTRSSSASSNVSTMGEDAVVATLRGLSMEEKDGAGSPRSTTPGMFLHSLFIIVMVVVVSMQEEGNQSCLHHSTPHQSSSPPAMWSFTCPGASWSTGMAYVALATPPRNATYAARRPRLLDPTCTGAHQPGGKVERWKGGMRMGWDGMDGMECHTRRC